MAVADGAEGGQQAPSSDVLAEAPRGELGTVACITVEPHRFLLVTAMLTALLTRAVSAVWKMYGPRSSVRSSPGSRSSRPCHRGLGCSVMSVHHSSLGLFAVKCRFTRSSGVATRIRLGMRRRGCGNPQRPCSVMIDRASLRLTFMS